MPSDSTTRIPERASKQSHALYYKRFFRRLSLSVLAALSVASLASCIVPFDTGANAAAMALDEMDNLAYAMRNESAELQVQIDSLASMIRKQDSLIRWLANLTGNPIPETPNWETLFPPTKPDSGATTTTVKPPPDSGTLKPKPPPT